MSRGTLGARRMYKRDLTLAGNHCVHVTEHLPLCSQAGIYNKSMCYKQSQCPLSLLLLLPTCACMCMRRTQWRRERGVVGGGGRGGAATRVHVRENLFPTHARTSAGQLLIEKKKGSFSALCPLWLHWGFSSQVTAFLSHVLAEQSAGTFHQSAGWDGSSGIILTVGPSQDEIRRCLADRHTHLPQSREILFHHHYYYSNHNHVPYDSIQKKQKETFICPQCWQSLCIRANMQDARKPAAAERLKLPANQSPPVLWKCTQAPCQRSKRTARAPSPMSGTRSFFSAENAKQYIKAPLGGSSRLRLSWLYTLSAARHHKRCCGSLYNDIPHLGFFYLTKLLLGHRFKTAGLIKTRND